MICHHVSVWMPGEDCGEWECLRDVLLILEHVCMLYTTRCPDYLCVM